MQKTVVGPMGHPPWSRKCYVIWGEHLFVSISFCMGRPKKPVNAHPCRLLVLNLVCKCNEWI